VPRPHAAIARTLLAAAITAGGVALAPGTASAATPAADVCGASTNDQLSSTAGQRTFTGTVTHVGEADNLSVTFFPGQLTQVYITGPTVDDSSFNVYGTDAVNGIGTVSFNTSDGWVLFATQTCDTAGSTLVNKIEGTTGDGSPFAITG
jgi:hypothetical protein